jgi:hypothetical protein
VTATKKEPARTARIVNNLQKGLPFRTACARAGVTSVTVYDWRRKDARFDERCRLAESFAERRFVVELLHGGEDPEDARKVVYPDAVRSANLRWFLERRWPQKYGVGLLREKAWEEEREESKGGSASVTMTPELMSAIVRFASMSESELAQFQRWQEFESGGHSSDM